MAMQEMELIEHFFKENWNYVVDKYHDRGLVTVTTKKDPSDLLTEVDLTIQKRFLDLVKERFPGDLVVGEEGDLAHIPLNAMGRAWVIDPIDGTYNFVRGINPLFGISIAFVQKGTAQAAGVAFPVNGMTFLAEQGSGSFCDGRRLRVSGVQHLNQACVEVDFSGIADRELFIGRAVNVIRKVGQLRCEGAAVGGICQVASGDVEAYLHMMLSPWDYAAAQLIAEEAGAVSTRLDGTPLRVFDGRNGLVISNGAIHEALLSCITSA